MFLSGHMLWVTCITWKAQKQGDAETMRNQKAGLWPQPLNVSVGLSVIPIVAVFLPEQFFSILNLLGISHSGEGSALYGLYAASVASVVVPIGAYLLLRNGKLALRDSILLLSPVILLAVYQLDVVLGRSDDAYFHRYVLWLILGYPALVAGMASRHSPMLWAAARVVEPLMLVMTVSTAVYVLLGVSTIVNETSFGGATYQTASYVAALAFVLNLYFLLFGHRHTQWTLFRSAAYKLLCLVMLPIQIGTCLLTGGRGGIVLIAVGGALLVGLSLARQAQARKRYVVAVLAIVAGGLIWMLPRMVASGAGQSRLSRVFSYLGPDGVNWQGTSGRDDLYDRAVASVGEAPVIGHGLFNWNGPYPHNFVLDVLLTGGVIYLVVCIWLFVVMGVALRDRIREEPGALILVPVALFPLVMLTFSGTYWNSSSFWFVLGALLSASGTRGRGGGRGGRDRRGSLSPRTPDIAGG